MAYKSTIHDTTTNYVFYKNDQQQTIQQPRHVVSKSTQYILGKEVGMVSIGDAYT